MKPYRYTLTATGNTEEQAMANLLVQRQMLEMQEPEKLIFGIVKTYGNFEIGYKLVQEYSRTQQRNIRNQRLVKLEHWKDTV